MADILLRGTPITTVGELPKVGSTAPDATLVDADLTDVKLSDYSGKKLLLNIFPSIDTGICAQSARTFNEAAAELGDEVRILCISKDLPFALGRFCAAEGIDGVKTLSAFRSSFGDDYGITMATGGLATLLSRSIVVIDSEGHVAYTQQVPEIGQEPDYEAALSALAEAV